MWKDKIKTDYVTLSMLLVIDGTSVRGLLHGVVVGHDADISDVHAASVFSVTATHQPTNFDPEEEGSL
jgi:hypothetical protein